MVAKKSIASEKGLATLETVPLLFVFVVMVVYGVGAFGIIHTGILNSIAARTYAFETFRHRSTLVYFRDVKTAEWYKDGIRIHGISSDVDVVTGADGQYITATERKIDRGFLISSNIRQDAASHKQLEANSTGGRTPQGVNPAWIKTQYGICLNAACGD